MPRYTVLGIASSEVSLTAADPRDAYERWRRLVEAQRHGRVGRLSVNLLCDTPTIFDAAGAVCCLPPPKKRSKRFPIRARSAVKS